MAGRGRTYTWEFKARMVELVWAGRSPDRLAREFKPSATAIRNWLAHADRDAERHGWFHESKFHEIIRIVSSGFPGRSEVGPVAVRMQRFRMTETLGSPTGRTPLRVSSCAPRWA